MTAAEQSAAEQGLAAAFTGHRAHLVGVAYRLTGSVADAEDAVQEAWLRLSRLSERGRADILDLRGWLTTVVGRICLDRLRSAAVRRERYVGQWLPEPLVTSFEDDPLEAVVRDDGVRMAALVLLDELTPEQRVAFVLHDAFGVPFDSIAETLGCAVATARQHASRGRRAASAAPPPPRVALDEQRELLEKFLAALAAGDVDTVVGLLHPDVVLVGDSDGKARTALNVITGPDKVSRFLFGLMRRYAGLPGGEPVLVNGDLGIKFATQGDLAARVSSFALRDGKVVALYDVSNPDKLTHVRF
ncbi:sigma-70 family RNA polymerase sigma factor [Actinosynnema sp. NPDC047251]|uniref:RNA polymerase, sigma-24 subunit, ECF subfamily n=1 Tax=Saccharothrix espanaensis (strain ATCC 51144 / DSM 44229 / JCM 9112 / NBRC 15066 / NRRL 15764) TaxID=1179773 RepID=K0JX87_SACES|nr:sigma-70 family RNA polymerase sigma factor [Saccharothrix espanaensis]CCH28848.1 RNA polymerase, sigma-24 subunit, ECF subfamily [Saccharothrix espanaensis DSM 44229]